MDRLYQLVRVAVNIVQLESRHTNGFHFAIWLRIAAVAWILLVVFTYPLQFQGYILSLLKAIISRLLQ